MKPALDRASLEHWLRTGDADKLECLWSAADEIRRTNVGDEVHLRGLIEISNHCARRCAYCGLHAGNRKLTRYRMSEDEIAACASQAKGLGFGTVVMQSGEDYGVTRDFMTGVVRRIKSETGLAVTLSLGERSPGDLRAWKEAGADRYLLRFETSDAALYEEIHPPLAEGRPGRFEILAELRRLGYEVGSGVMIGIPGQTYASLANDIETFRRLDLDMIGVGPYIPHPDTALAHRRAAAADQVPNTEEMTYKVIALTRMMCPAANIPSTTALATINKKNGRELGLQRGANVVMPNLTPLRYRACYEIYPDKACLLEEPTLCSSCLTGRITSIGRTPGRGPGSRKPATP